MVFSPMRMMLYIPPLIGEDSAVAHPVRSVPPCR